MKLHLIGIAGTGMGSLAGLLKAAGHDVRGSDEHIYPPMSTQLAEQSIAIFAGFSPENLNWGPDRVVVGNICRRDHIEVLAAQERGIPLVSFPALLSEVVLSNRNSIVIAGTHGKTTTSSLMSFLLTEAGRDPSFLIGGVPINFQRSWGLGQGPDFVVEGDEYDTAFFDKKSKFLHYQPKLVVLTSVEYDHADIFPNLDAVKSAFIELVTLIPKDGCLVVCTTSPHAIEVAKHAQCSIVTYGRPGHDTEWTFDISGRKVGSRTFLRIVREGKTMCTLETGMAGVFNMENLTGVVAAAHFLGIDTAKIVSGSRKFLGVKRRQEIYGTANGVTVVDDFAHHPTAIRETLGALKGRHGPGKLIAAFEPRSATSRRSVFQKEFVDAFSLADEVLLAPLYAPEKVPAELRLDLEKLAADLRSQHIPTRVIGTTEEAALHLQRRSSPGDTVVIMSSGSFGGLHDSLLQKLGDPVRPARAEDRLAIRQLLDRAGLNQGSKDVPWSNFLVMPSQTGADLASCVAVQHVDEDALLCLLAVSPERREEGLGYLLLESAMKKARSDGALHLYLVTDGKQGVLGEKLGFDLIDRPSFNASIVATVEYQMARSKTATWMRKEL
jgi:UDP-N-acetylmuramate: L-alanyl-gamma-D-glutamyl-meso-diaminopimelate ligase